MGDTPEGDDLHVKAAALTTLSAHAMQATSTAASSAAASPAEGPVGASEMEVSQAPLPPAALDGVKTEAVASMLRPPALLPDRAPSSAPFSPSAVLSEKALSCESPSGTTDFAAAAAAVEHLAFSTNVDLFLEELTLALDDTAVDPTAAVPTLLKVPLSAMAPPMLSLPHGAPSADGGGYGSEGYRSEGYGGEGYAPEDFPDGGMLDDALYEGRFLRESSTSFSSSCASPGYLPDRMMMPAGHCGAAFGTAPPLGTAAAFGAPPAAAPAARGAAPAAHALPPFAPPPLLPVSPTPVVAPPPDESASPLQPSWSQQPMHASLGNFASSDGLCGLDSPGASLQSPGFSQLLAF